MIWILWHRRVGDLKQMEVLAKALGMPFVVKQLEFNFSPLAAWAKLSLASDSLHLPWPELVLCAEALTSVVARRLRAKSGGKIKIVSLARPYGDVRNFDLVLTTAQYRLPRLPHVVELVLPLTEPLKLGAVPLNDVTSVLVGASSPPEQLNRAVAAEMADRLMAHAKTHQKQLRVVTSPRSSVEVAQELKDRMLSPHKVYVWSKEIENPYRHLLGEASDFIVTSDSISMLGDAVATGKPVQVYKLPRKFTKAQTCVEWLFKRAPNSWIFNSGLIEPATDRWLLVERLVEKGYVRWFEDKQKPTKTFDPQADIDVAVGALLKLLSEGSPSARWAPPAAS